MRNTIRTFLGTVSVLLLLMGSGGSEGFIFPLLIGAVIISYLAITSTHIYVNGVRIRRIK